MMAMRSPWILVFFPVKSSSSSMVRRAPQSASVTAARRMTREVAIRDFMAHLVLGGVAAGLGGGAAPRAGAAGAALAAGAGGTAGSGAAGVAGTTVGLAFK